MENNQLNYEGEESLDLADKLACLAESMKKDTALLRQVLDARDEYIRQLEAELERLTNDPWSSRVTYDNVVELIASNEDTRERDMMRHVFEPMLKREQVRQLRRDVKRRVKELEESEGPASGVRTFVNNGTYNEVQPGGSNITNIKERG